jgi:hypothetical protein
MENQDILESVEETPSANKRLLLPKLMVLLALVTLAYAFYFKTYEVPIETKSASNQIHSIE